MTEPLRAEALIGNGRSPIVHPDADPCGLAVEATIVTLEEFAEVEEEGAAALLGEPGSILIPENADIMFYGDGGAGKTTLSVDLAFHLGSGTDWLGIPVPRPVPVLMIENEGPRALMREKLKRKLAAWDGPQLEGRVRVFEAPWGAFSFADVAWRETWTPVFLAALERSGSVRLAARLAGVGRSTAYDRRERDAEFAAAWDAAFETGRTERQIYVDGVCPRCGRPKLDRRSR